MGDNCAVTRCEMIIRENYFLNPGYISGLNIGANIMLYVEIIIKHKFYAEMTIIYVVDIYRNLIAKFSNVKPEKVVTHPRLINEC